MQIIVAITFGICAIVSYSAGKREGSIKGGLDAIEILRLANIISINEKGEISPAIHKRQSATKRKSNK